MSTDPWLELSSSLPEGAIPAKKQRKKHRIACGRCGTPMHLRGYNYVCPDRKCNAKHRAHPSGKPTGIPADRQTARARMEAHKTFDQLWRSGKVSRPQAYTILRRIMGMTIEETHIGRFTWEQCQFLISRLNELGDRVYDYPYTAKGFLTISNSR